MRTIPTPLIACAVCIGALIAPANASTIGAVEAIDLAQRATDAQAFKAELDQSPQGLRYEIDLIAGQTVYDVKVDAFSGAVRDIRARQEDARDTGEINAVLANAGGPIDDAIDHARSLYPFATLIEADVEIDNGLGLYKLELIDGVTKLELEIDAVSGQLVRSESSSLSPLSPWFGFDPGAASPQPPVVQPGQPGQAMDVADVIALVRQRYASGRISKVEFETEHGVGVYDVYLVFPRQVLDIRIDATTGQEIRMVRRRGQVFVRRQLGALSRSQLTIDAAAEIARQNVVGQTVRSVSLNHLRSGRPFEIEVETEHGRRFVRLNSRNGIVTRVEDR